MGVSSGAKVHAARLKRMMNLNRESMRELGVVAEKIRYDAQNSIREGAISGPGHVPSLPGQPPSADSHVLDTGIRTQQDAARGKYLVISTAPYSAFLEYGTSRILPRPFMGPALRKNKSEIVKGQIRAVNKVVKG